MKTHYCEPSDGICRVNTMDDGFIAEAGDPSTWCCHDWATCFAMNAYIAAGLTKAYTVGYDDSAFGWPRGHHLASLGLLK